jgi:hypothetical protein
MVKKRGKNPMLTRPQAAVQFRLFPNDAELVAAYAEKTGKPVASAIRALVLEHVGRELGVNVDLSAYDNSASIHAEMAKKAGLTLAQYQAVALRTMTQALREGAADLPTLLHATQPARVAAPVDDEAPDSPRITRPRRRRAK